MLSLEPIITIVGSLITAIILGLCKEFYDYFIQKDNNKTQVIHDLVCNVLGILISLIIILIQNIISK
jgi:hypothetical protein